jgi:hypothetical protein
VAASTKQYEEKPSQLITISRIIGSACISNTHKCFEVMVSQLICQTNSVIKKKACIADIGKEIGGFKDAPDI